MKAQRLDVTKLIGSEKTLSDAKATKNTVAMNETPDGHPIGEMSELMGKLANDVQNMFKVIPSLFIQPIVRICYPRKHITVTSIPQDRHS